MKNIFNGTLKAVGRVFERMIPDEEAARKMTEQYIRMYNLESKKR